MSSWHLAHEFVTHVKLCCSTPFEDRNAVWIQSSICDVLYTSSWQICDVLYTSLSRTCRRKVRDTYKSVLQRLFLCPQHLTAADMSSWHIVHEFVNVRSCAAAPLSMPATLYRCSQDLMRHGRRVRDTCEAVLQHLSRCSQHLSSRYEFVAYSTRVRDTCEDVLRHPFRCPQRCIDIVMTSWTCCRRVRDTYVLIVMTSWTCCRRVRDTYVLIHVYVHVYMYCNAV